MIMDANLHVQGASVRPAPVPVASVFSDDRAHVADDGRNSESVVDGDACVPPPASPPHRVLYIVSQFPSLSETFIVRELSALIAQGVDVRILSLKPPRDVIVQDQAARLMDRVIYPAGLGQTLASALRRFVATPWPMLTSSRTLVSNFWRRPTLLAKSAGSALLGLGRANEIECFGPQLIHATWATYPATVAWFLSRVLNRPFTFTSRAHDIFIEDHMMQEKLTSTALAVTITEHNVRFMSRWMPAPGSIPVKVIHSSLNLPEFPFSRVQRASGRLLSVGRLVPMKGFDILLYALAQLRDRGRTFTCTIIGEGPERAKLEALRSKLGLVSVVELPGIMVQADVARHMTDATLMVLPCVVAPNGQSDGIPNVLMEAMASGLPVISTRVSGIPELVDDGVSGRLVDPGDAVALADAIESLLTDTDAQERFAKAGRSKVEQEFNIDREASRLLEHFRAVCHVQ